MYLPTYIRIFYEVNKKTSLKRVVKLAQNGTEAVIELLVHAFTIIY